MLHNLRGKRHSKKRALCRSGERGAVRWTTTHQRRKAMERKNVKSNAKPAVAIRATKATKGRLAAEPTGCQFDVEWRMLTSTAGMTQVWIPTKEYRRVAAALAKLTRSEAKLANLRARKQSIGVTHVCRGTCGGGWCKEVDVPQPGASLLTECQCAYFV
jgi:hypothetical protein